MKPNNGTQENLRINTPSRNGPIIEVFGNKAPDPLLPIYNALNYIRAIDFSQQDDLIFKEWVKTL